MISIYVAGASKELTRAKDFIKALNASGLYDVVQDWPATISHAGSANRNLDADVRKNSARDCLDAVRECEVFVFLIPDVETRGAWGELCAALILNKLVVISGCTYNEDASIFCSLANVPVVNDDDTNGQGDRINIGRTQARTDQETLKWLFGYAYALQGMLPEKRQSDETADV